MLRATILTKTERREVDLLDMRARTLVRHTGEGRAAEREGTRQGPSLVLPLAWDESVLGRPQPGGMVPCLWPQRHAPLSSLCIPQAHSRATHPHTHPNRTRTTPPARAAHTPSDRDPSLAKGM